MLLVTRRQTEKLVVIAKEEWQSHFMQRSRLQDVRTDGHVRGVELGSERKREKKGRRDKVRVLAQCPPVREGKEVTRANAESCQ